MNKQSRRDFLKLAGAAMVTATGVASASENPFAIKEMEGGYSQVATNHMEGKCGEGKCGGDKAKAKTKEGNCGGNKAAPKAMEGNCGGNKMQEGSCGGNKAAPKAKEGKCGEGKCGGNS
ncbi:MAG: twin-arginine translocation signal domain-containing protein [Pseudomonadota bacterium]|nr:twin-arginine translocation signal domain-containing protein [Pseudomonadota bacterium]